MPAEKVLDTSAENKKFVAFYIPSSNVGEVYELSSPVKNKTPNSRNEFTSTRRERRSSGTAAPQLLFARRTAFALGPSKTL